jgi:hypothetical protein
MMGDWPGVRVIKRNPLLRTIHEAAINAGREAMDSSNYMWKKAICDAIGAPDYYCRERRKGPLNWDFIKDGVDELLNGPRPRGNGDLEAVQRYRRNKITLIPMTMHFFEAVETAPDLREVDPSMRRLWLPTKAGEVADGWISNRAERFAVIIDEHFEHKSELDNSRLHATAGAVAGSYDAKVLSKSEARALIADMLRAPMPLTLEDLTGL